LPQNTVNLAKAYLVEKLFITMIRNAEQQMMIYSDIAT